MQAHATTVGRENTLHRNLRVNPALRALTRRLLAQMLHMIAKHVLVANIPLLGQQFALTVPPVRSGVLMPNRTKAVSNAKLESGPGLESNRAMFVLQDGQAMQITYIVYNVMQANTQTRKVLLHVQRAVQVLTAGRGLQPAFLVLSVSSQTMPRQTAITVAKELMRLT